MSEEERKAIHKMKRLLSYSKEHEYFSPFQEQEIDDMDIVLKLVDKQQKEIEEKTTIIMAGAEKVKQLESQVEELLDVLDSEKKINYIKPIDIPVHNYISKDKIREKLKELEEQFKKYENEGLSGFVSKIDKGTRIEVLKELLEDN